MKRGIQLGLYLALLGFLAGSVSAHELSVPPVNKSSVATVGNWATASGTVYFMFAVPDDLESLESAKVVMLGTDDKQIVYDLWLSVAEDGGAHDAVDIEILNTPATAIDDAIFEIDVSLIFGGVALKPGLDTVTLGFRADPMVYARVLLLRFQYESTLELEDGTSEGDLLSWDAAGNNWVARPPAAHGHPSDTADNMQPWQAVNYIIALTGTFPSRSSADPLLAEIAMFAGNFAPRGWALCDGQIVAISSNPALFSLLGTTYGGDGRTTFGLPDLRGRVPVHAGTGPGLTIRRLGAKGGAETDIHSH